MEFAGGLGIEPKSKFALAGEIRTGGIVVIHANKPQGFVNSVSDPASARHPRQS